MGIIPIELEREDPRKGGNVLETQNTTDREKPVRSAELIANTIRENWPVARLEKGRNPAPPQDTSVFVGNANSLISDHAQGKSPGSRFSVFRSLSVAQSGPS